MELTSAFYITASILVILVGISKAGLAGGMGSLCVPILTNFVPLPIAAGIFLPIMVVMDSGNLWLYRKHVDLKMLMILIPGGILGIGLGALSFGLMEPEWIKIMVGTIGMVFAAQHFTSHLIPSIDKTLPRRSGVIFAAMSGFTSHLAHAGSPPLRAYMLNQNMGKSAFVGTFGYFFALANLIKLIPYISFGQITGETLRLSIMFFALIPIGMFLGVKLHKAIPQDKFRQLAYILLILASGKLLIDGIREVI